MTLQKALQNDKPVFVYISECCNSTAQKPPCIKPPKNSNTAFSTLGTWRCSSCHRVTKVKRIKPGE